ncbi:hypothetical protein Tel_04345 [Candidatus Tenderia electrophaga]|jgi:hypothetical protein|uniref:DUF2914 domain-containing protein n=1 Tax=Candidatus Tenderia electrophaga TaxID=1748243 RepID=A0A0S2TBH4_9GAMM|nr:hypothetical protein Tel_04345 [Candidatus Tenderia electrophaga]
MNKDAFNIGITITLLATLISGGNLARAATPEAMPETNIGVISGSVARSTFTQAVVNREPKEPINELSNAQRHIYYFTELKGMAGQTATHRWIYDGQTMAEVKFDVGAPRWRVWSSKTLMPEWTGTWTVSVLNELGQEIYSESFEYINAATD